MSFLYDQGFKQYYDEFLRQDDRDDGPGRARRPHNDEVVMYRCLVLQGWYGLSDLGLEAQLKTNTCFMNFIGFDA